MSELIGQISMFSVFPEEDWNRRMLRQDLRKGKLGWRDSRIRIYTAATRLDKDRLADYIQNEYGICGGTVNDGAEGGCIDYNCRGAEIRRFKTGEWTRVPWCRIRDMIVELINNGEYLTAEDREEIEKIRKEHSGSLPLMPPAGMNSREEA